MTFCFVELFAMANIEDNVDDLVLEAATDAPRREDKDDDGGEASSGGSSMLLSILVDFTEAAVIAVLAASSDVCPSTRTRIPPSF
mmetsp:Transcript_21396/g.32977  ORF Transcript_21396/g.32977 Transcript_21396/m.32977 type:complete len:85 (-) Transcript_21396:569-823(-)